MATDKTKRLGRGLDALFVPQAPASNELRFAARQETVEATPFRSIPVSAIVANPQQPRKDFGEAELAELRTSIRANGLLQPLLVRPKGQGYELVAGERRLRAVQSLGWREVPAHVRELDDQAVLTLALIENLQRSDLNPIEEAEGYQELINRFSLTQQQVSDAVGRERSTVANMLRLLALPESVRKMVRGGEVSLGHARALLGLSDAKQMLDLAGIVAKEGLTVREVERRVRDASQAGLAAKPKARRGGAVTQPAEARAIADQLRKKFQTDVHVTTSGGGKGEVRLSFYSADDLERLLDLLLGPTREVL
jgi:ParB family chromosome partitioning protein